MSNVRRRVRGGILGLAVLALSATAYAQLTRGRTASGGSQSSAAAVGAQTQALDDSVPRPLASHPQAQSMVQQAVGNLALNVSVKFLDKTYENDQYAREPITGKRVRVSCLRFKATSGFALKVDAPQFALSGPSLTVTQNIAKIEANSLTYRFQVGVCQDVSGGGLGVKVTNAKLTYTARPMLSYDQGKCKLVWDTNADDAHVSIGDINFVNMQNDLEKLAKNAVEDAVNSMLKSYFESGLRVELAKVANSTCGGGTKGP